MVHPYFYSLWAKLGNERGQKGGGCRVWRLPRSTQSICEERDAQVGIFLESCTNGTDKVVFCLANVEGAKINSMLSF